jgi:uncharacterized membrane protein YbhN (UPF0104 family)
MPRKNPVRSARTPAFRPGKHRRSWIRVLVFGLFMYLLAAGYAGLKLSVTTLRNVEPMPLLLAIVIIFFSYVAATITYLLLCPRKLPVIPTFLVEVSGGLVNRLLPGGLGGLGINAFYMMKRGCTGAQAAAIVGTNNLLGFIGNMVLLGIVILILPVPAVHYAFPRLPWYFVAGIILVIVVLAVLAARQKRLRSGVGHSLAEAGSFVAGLVRRPAAASGALLSSMALTSLHVLALWLVLAAVGSPVGLPVALFAITAGAASGAAVPTPGGIGGAEAGISAALAAFGVSLPLAIAAALMYRLITYWLPLLPGYAALAIVEKRYL